MTITKTDLDKWIERDAYQKFPPQFASDQPGYDRAKYSREQYIEAAQLSAPLLLQALEALRSIGGISDDTISNKWVTEYELRDRASEACAQIEATINNTGKGG